MYQTSCEFFTTNIFTLLLAWLLESIKLVDVTYSHHPFMYKFITINAIRVMAGNLCTCQNPFTGYVCSLFHYGVGYIIKCLLTY